MSIDQITSPAEESLSAIEDALREMMQRLRELTNAPALSEQGMVEITAIYNNVAYIFLYLEANEEYRRYDKLLPWRDAFHRDDRLDQRILTLLVALTCDDPEAEESRLAYIAQLQDKARAGAGAGEEDDNAAALLTGAKAVLASSREDEREMMRRLGAAGDLFNPASAFYRLTANTTSAVTRDKLARAWRSRRDAHRDELIALIDQMVQARREHCLNAGYESVAERTFEKCYVKQQDVSTFIERYLVSALSGYERLRKQVQASVDVAGDPMNHFEFYTRRLGDGIRVPRFRLDECLQFILEAAQNTFGLSMRVLPRTDDQVITVSVRTGDRDAGHVNFDLWDTAAKAAGANHTQGLRNRTDWMGIVQTPVAYVSCRFQRDANEVGWITFQNVHSLYHEFGHAVNHLLIRHKISNRSGLEYLPLERLEFLSMWFEKWVYHPSFAEAVSSSASVTRDQIAWCRRVKAIEYQRTYVERAVTAALDFELHRRPSGGLAECFAELDDRHGVSRYCALGDFPAYFTWPMFQANPGANFAYLWGASESVQKFLPFEELSLSAIGTRPGLREGFTSSFDFALPTETPNSDVVFEFYDRLAQPAEQGTPDVGGTGHRDS